MKGSSPLSWRHIFHRFHQFRSFGSLHCVRTTTLFALFLHLLVLPQDSSAAPAASKAFSSSAFHKQENCPRVCRCRHKEPETSDEELHQMISASCLGGALNDIDFLNILQTLPDTLESLKLRAPNGMNRSNSFQWNDNINKFVNLKRLELVNCGIPAISQSVRLPALRELDLSGNRIFAVQIASFMGLQRLERLDLSRNQINVLPSGAFIYLKQLKSLSLGHNRLATLATSLLRGPEALKELVLEGNQLPAAQLNGLFVDTPELTKLELGECGLNDTELGKLNLGRVPKVKTLGIGGNNLTQVPSSTLRALEFLEDIDLSNNFIKALGPCSFCGFPARRVSLRGNFLGLSLPESINREAFAETKLMELDLSNNHLNVRGEQAFTSKLLGEAQNSLETLHLSGNGFSRMLPQLIVTLPRLSALHFAQNGIRELEPMDIVGGQYANLKTLNLSGNALESLPLALKKLMPDLEVLDISNNQFRGFSTEFISAVVEHLQELHLRGNPWNCDCSIQPLYTFFLATLSADSTGEEEQDPAQRWIWDVVCAQPKHLNGQPIYRLKEVEECGNLLFGQTPLGLSQATQMLLLLAIILILAFLVTCVTVLVLYCGRSNAHKGTYVTGEDLSRSRLSAPVVLEATHLLLQDPEKQNPFSPHQKEMSYVLGAEGDSGSGTSPGSGMTCLFLNESGNNSNCPSAASTTTNSETMQQQSSNSNGLGQQQNYMGFYDENGGIRHGDTGLRGVLKRSPENGNNGSGVPLRTRVPPLLINNTPTIHREPTKTTLVTF